MSTVHYGDPHSREEHYIDFRDVVTGNARKPACTRVVSEHPLITVDLDEAGDVIGVCVRAPLEEPENANDIANITRTT